MDLLSQIFTTERETEIPLIYSGRRFVRNSKKPLFVALIGPSGAGKDAIKERLLHTGKFHHIRTATNRQMRENENPREYIWMRSRYENEPEKPYLRSLIRQYDLFEYNYHYGNMYGTPLDSLKNAITSKKIPLYCSENKGALFLEKTLSEVYDVMIIFIVPDSLEDMEKRITHGSRNNPTTRLIESREKIEQSPQVAHYLVKNPSNPVEYGKSGFESAVHAVKRLIFTSV